MNASSTPQAQKLKRELERHGLTVRDEVYDRHKHIDLVIHRARLNIEVDGRQHYDSARQILSDLDRSHYSDIKGWDTIHIPNIVIDDSTELPKVAAAVAKAAYVRIYRNGNRLPYHHYAKKH